MIPFNGKAIADFHIHTTASDGAITPRAIMGAAHKKSKLGFLSFTDHHTTKAFDDVEAIKDWYNITVLPGVEISTSDYKGLHILGLGMSKRTNMELTLSKISSNNEMQLLRILFNLKEIGIDLGDEFIQQTIKASNVSREGIAQELVKQGHAKSVEQAYNKYTSSFSTTGTVTTKPSAKEAIELINKSGGIASIAHPGSVTHRQSRNWLKENEWQQLLEELTGYGLKGIEAIFPSHRTNESSEFFDAQAKNFKLIRTGGNDFHGNKKDFKEEIGNPHIKQKDIDNLLSAIKNSNDAINSL